MLVLAWIFLPIYIAGQVSLRASPSAVHRTGEMHPDTISSRVPGGPHLDRRQRAQGLSGAGGAWAPAALLARKRRRRTRASVSEAPRLVAPPHAQRSQLRDELPFLSPNDAASDFLKNGLKSHFRSFWSLPVTRTV